jgi:hypothetical protein
MDAVVAACTAVLRACDPMEKVRVVREALGPAVAALQTTAPPTPWLGSSPTPDWPGRPAKPQLLDPKEMPTPAALKCSHELYIIHALAHVELNAVDMYCDTLVRGLSSDDMRVDDADTAAAALRYTVDLAGVVADESRHFSMLSERLREMGHAYGDLPAHKRLWEHAVSRRGSLLLLSLLSLPPLLPLLSLLSLLSLFSLLSLLSSLFAPAIALDTLDAVVAGVLRLTHLRRCRCDAGRHEGHDAWSTRHRAAGARGARSGCRCAVYTALPHSRRVTPRHITALSDSHHASLT